MNKPYIASRAPSRSVAAACCFDFDGLLADTAGAWTSAYAAACRRHGAQDLDSAELAALQGASLAGAAAALSRQLGSEIAPARLLSDLTRAFRSGPPPALPGAAGLLESLWGKTRLVVVTNAPGWLVAESLTILGLQRYFDSVVSADRVPNGKPAPDVYLTACEEAGISPADAIAFEDSAVGVRAARTAGLRVVGVPPAEGSLDADLVVPALNDPRVLPYIGLIQELT